MVLEYSWCNSVFIELGTVLQLQIKQDIIGYEIDYSKNPALSVEMKLLVGN